MQAQRNVDLSELECKVLDANQASTLEAHVTNLLIYETIKSMKKNKAPGPAGVNVEFFYQHLGNYG